MEHRTARPTGDQTPSFQGDAIRIDHFGGPANHIFEENFRRSRVPGNGLLVHGPREPLDVVGGNFIEDRLPPLAQATRERVAFAGLIPGGPLAGWGPSWLRRRFFGCWRPPRGVLRDDKV